MLWYIVLIGLILLDFGLECLLKYKNILTDEPNKSKLNRVLKFIFKYRLITIISLVMFSTFKAFSVGMDMSEYRKFYRLWETGELRLFVDTLGNKLELGYCALNSILVLIGADFRVLLFLISLFVSISMVLFVNKLSSNKIMSVLLYVMLGTFAQSLSVLRQIIAVAFLMLAIIKLIDKKWGWAIALILIACTFHISAILCLVVVPLRFIKPKLWLVGGMFSIAIVGSIAFPYFLKLLERFTVLDFYTKYYIVYANLRGASNLLNILYSVAIIVLFTVLYIARFKWLKLDEKDIKIYDFFLLLFMFVPLFRIIGFIAEMPELFNRFNMYFFIALMILIPLFVKGLKFNINLYKVANISVYIIAICYMIYLYAIKNTCGVYPFVFM